MPVILVEAFGLPSVPQNLDPKLTSRSDEWEQNHEEQKFGTPETRGSFERALRRFLHALLPFISDLAILGIPRGSVKLPIAVVFDPTAPTALTSA